MTDFDLVPQEFRMRLSLHRWLRRLGVAIATTVVIATASRAALAYANNSLDTQIQQLQTQHAMTTQQRTQLEALDAHIGELRRQWQLLTALRSGAPAERIFTVIDAALGDAPVWFHSWAFVRYGAAGEDGPPVGKTGYFIIVPDTPNTEQPPTWLVETHIRISGQAQDHAALSGFVRSLFQRDEVRDVRVQKTALHRYATANVVDFELAILLNSDDSQT